MIASKEQVATKKPTKNQKLLPSVFDTKIQEIYTSRISPRRSVIRKREPKKAKNDNEHIMIEFNPATSKQGEKVTLIPLNPSKKH